MHTMNKEEYLGCCYEQLLEIFNLAKSHKEDDKKISETKAYPCW